MCHLACILVHLSHQHWQLLVVLGELVGLVAIHRFFDDDAFFRHDRWHWTIVVLLSRRLLLDSFPCLFRTFALLLSLLAGNCLANGWLPGKNIDLEKPYMCLSNIL